MKVNRLKACFPWIGFVFSFFAALFLFSCQTAVKFSNGVEPSSEPVPFMANARTGVLPSGLRYYILENSMPQGRAFLTLAVNAGSVLEAEDEQGLAHFVEHMAFNGTGRFPESRLIDYLRSLGMRFGPEVNAYTSYDQTVYGIEVPVENSGSSRRVPDTALAVIDDWTRAITFTPADVDDERSVIMEEHRARLGAWERISRRMLSLLFQGSPYAERLPIGLPEIIENVPAKRLEEFYKKWYRPDNMALIFVGDFDAELLETSLEDHFRIAPAAEPLERPYYTLPGPRAGKIQSLVITDPEYPQARVDLYFKRTAELPRSDTAGYRNDVIAYLADTVLAYRFDEASSAPDTPYIQAGAGTVRYGHGSRFYVLTAQAKTGLSGQVLEELLRVKESLVRYGFSEDEADMAKRSLLSYMEQMAAEKDRQDSNYYVRAFTSHFLQGETVPDIEWELEALKTMLPAITLDEINLAAKDYFAGDDLTVFVSAPESEKESLPTEEEIAALTVNIRQAVIAPPVSTVVSGEFLEETPLPGVIVSEFADPETGAVRWKLSNGMEVILKETSNRNNEISLYALARGGTASVPPEQDVSASLAAEMMNASGLGPYTRPELTRKLADKQVSFSLWTSPFLRGFQGAAALGDLKTLMEMVYLGFTRIRMDPGAISVLLEQIRTRLIQESENPDSFFSREVMKTIYGNPRFHPMETGDLDRVNVEDAAEFILQCQNPGDYTFVFTGSLNPALMRPLVETYLASIPAKDSSFDTYADEDYQRPGPANREIRKGREERSSVYMSWIRAMAFSEEDSAAAAVLQEYLDILLTEEIRESLGGVYSISPWVSLSPVPRGELEGGLYFVCNPGRAEELIAKIGDLIEQIGAGQIDNDKLIKSREALAREHEQSVQNNLYIAQSYANSAVIYGSSLSRLDTRLKLYQAVSAEDMMNIAVRLIETGPVRMILYPESWK